jgi:outer membrane protein TolC
MQQAWLKMPIAQLEEQALMRNADLSEGFYNSRIAREETRRVLLKLFPGISFNFGPKHSDDDYLINQSWREAGLQLSFKLLGLLSAPAQLNLAEAGVALADQKRLVAQMAVLTQLHVARLQYTNNMRQFERADSITGVEQRLATHVANQVDAEKQTKLDRVSQQTSLILAQLRRFQALSNTQASASKLQATLGMEPMVEATSSDTLPELAKAIGQALKLWDSGILPQLPEDKKE